MIEKKKGAKGAVVLIVLAALCVIGASVYLALGMTAEEAAEFGAKAEVFFRERVVPVALGITGGIAVMLTILAPVMAKVRASAERFGEAADTMVGAESQTARATDEICSFKAETLAGISAALSEMKAQNRAEIDGIRAEVTEACSQIAGVAGDVSAVLDKVQRLSDAMAVQAAADPVLVSAGKAREVVSIVKGQGDGHDE